MYGPVRLRGTQAVVDPKFISHAGLKVESMHIFLKDFVTILVRSADLVPGTTCWYFPGLRLLRRLGDSLDLDLGM